MKLKIAVILILMIVLGGLDNYRELNQLAIVSSISIDKAENGNYLLSAQIINTKKSASGTTSGGSSSEVTVFTKESSSIQEGLRDVINESPKKLYIAHMNAVIISEEVAKENIDDCVDFFIRDNETGIGQYIIIARDGTKAGDVLKIITPIENNSTKNLVQSIEANLKYQGTVIESTLLNVAKDLLNEDKTIKITACKLIGDVKSAENKKNLENSETKVDLILAEIAYFDGLKLKGYLDVNDSKMLNLLNDDIKNTIMFFEIDGYKISFETKSIKSDFKVRFADDHLHMDIDIKSNIVITEKDSNIEASTEQEIKYIESKFDDYIKTSIKAFLENVKSKYMVDLIGLKNYIYKYDNKLYNQVESNYLEEFTYSITSKSSLDTEGGVLKKW